MVEMDPKKARYLVGSIATMRDSFEKLHESVEGIIEAVAQLNYDTNPDDLKKLQGLANADVIKNISEECNDIILQCKQTAETVFNKKI